MQMEWFVLVGGLLLGRLLLLGLERLKPSSASARCPHGVSREGCAACAAERRAELERSQAERQAQEERGRRVRETLRYNLEELQRYLSSGFRSVEKVREMDPFDFEALVGSLLREEGFEVVVTGQSNDRGRDIVARRGDETLVVECKRYAADKAVGRPELQKLYAAMMEGKADGARLVTTGRFARTAADYADATGIELVDADALQELLARHLPPADAGVRRMCSECHAVVSF